MRIPILGLLTVFTIFMAFKANDVKLQWGLPRLLPDHDSTLQANERFEEMFGNDKLTILLAIDRDPLKDVELFNKWHDLSTRLMTVRGVDTVLSVNSLLNIEKDTENKTLNLRPISSGKVKNKAELEAIDREVRSLPFYKGKVFTDSSDISIMAVVINTGIFNSPGREELMNGIVTSAKQFEAENDIDLKYSGLPYIRNETTSLIKSELKMFVVFATLVTILVLIMFFRSAPPVIVSMLIVLMGVIWSLGIIALLDFKITILSSIIPPLIIVIGIPNSVYLINKYHAEYSAHGNKILALTRIIRKIGKATLMTNITTAIGFSTFIFTQSRILVEFGIVAALNILLLFTLSIFLIPGILSFLKPPRKKHTRHLEKPRLKRIVELLVRAVTSHRKVTYIITTALIVFGIYGLSKITTTGNLVDDLPHNHPVVEDLKFLESKLGGVMPFEIIVDTKKPGQAARLSTLKKIDKLYDVLEEYPEFANPVSVIDGVKFIRQAFYGGDPAQYKLISGSEKTFIKPYMSSTGEQDIARNFLDPEERFARISIRMKDIGTKEMEGLVRRLRADVDEIFNPESYEVKFAGSSLVYLKGTNYLVKNLFISLALAIIIISFLMAALFSSFRMIAMSIFTNLIPLLLTAALMGYFGIALKPSTLLIFSIAFGISIDDTIHYLAKYRQELAAHNWNVRIACISAIRETGVSMMYTSVILLFGFSVFATSKFGGTQAMGILVSITLLIAMVANLVLLPSFLLSMDRSITTKAFKEPFMQIWDEEEDIDYDALEMEETQNGSETEKEENKKQA